MKVQKEIKLITNDTYSIESLGEMVTAMEKLEAYKEALFNKANAALTERVNRLINIKSRINRANQIIQTYPNINKAITIKSKLVYPQQNHLYYHTFEYDQNVQSVPPKINNPILNRNPWNDPNLLGKESKAFAERMVTVTSLRNIIPLYNDLVEDLNKICPEISIMNTDEMGGIDPIIDFVTSDFDFYKKKKIEEIKKTNLDMNFPERESKAVMEFLNNGKDKKKEKPILEEAPKGLKDNIQPYVYTRNLLQQENKVFQLNLNTNLTGLGGVAQIDNFDNNVDDIQKVNQVAKSNTLFDDDIDFDPNMDMGDEDLNMPLDMIRSRNKNPFEKIQNAISNPAQPTQPSSQPVQASQPTSSTVPSPPSTVPSVPTAPSVPQPPAGNVPVPPPMNIVPPKAPAAPQAPKAPTPPPQAPPSAPQVVSAPIGGSVPVPPPLLVPKVDPELAKKRQEEAKKKPEPKKPPEKRPLTMQEEIAMAKLKKVGAVKVEQKEEKPKAKPQTSMMDLLKQQINLRFKQLKKHEEEEEESDEEEEW